MLKRLIFTLIFVGQITLLSAQTRIISFDGGGIRGAASLKILKELQKETGLEFHKAFDVYAGTSTGSLVAISLACGMDIEQILSDYQEMSADVFSSESLLTFFRPKYDPSILKKYIVQTLENAGYYANATLGDLPKKIVIPTVTLEDTKSGRWKLKILENFTAEGKKIKIVDAVLESTAAPTYFPSKNGCIDGGMAMKDPSLAALMAAFNPKTSDLKDFAIFSVGTGYDQDAVSGNESWGYTQWLTNLTGSNEGTIPLVEVLMDVSDQIPEQVCSMLLGQNYTKFDFPLTQDFALDDYPKIPKLLKFTEDYIQTNPELWSKTCQRLKEMVN